MQLKTFFIALLACSLLAGCYGPGQGRDADAGRARGAQLIRSIEAFHEKNSRYPRTLEELVPTQLSRQELAQLLVKPPLFDYGSNPQQYDLTFTYSAYPGTVTCGYSSAQVGPAWSCRGSY